MAPAWLWALAALLALGPVPRTAEAQIGVSNLLIGQSGNVPFLTPEDRTDLYDQLNLEYRFESGRIGVRFETDQNSEDLYNYRLVTQRYAEWSDERLRLRVGNVYAILGRGLIHRSFEVPGVVLDQPGARSRYGFSRDLDGALVEGSLGPVSARIIGGAPNGGDFSPGFDPDGTFRYRGQIGGGQLEARLPRSGRVGAAFARLSDAFAAPEALGSGFAEVDPLALVGVRAVALPIYFEYAQENAAFADWWRFRTGRRVTHALYSSLNLLWSDLTLSAEWKDYRRFRFGTNDPPSLVREHGWTLLNRATHVLDAEAERGFQIEASQRLPRVGSVVLNWSRSDNVRGGRFEERYAEARVALEGRPWEATAFVDGGEDGFLFVRGRTVWGGAATARILRDWSVNGEAEFARAHRGIDRFRDRAASLGVARAGAGSLTFLYEHSTDPEQWDPERPGRPRRFLAAQASARVSDAHELTLFAGERRGGRACTAGTCYQVAAFKGVELRVTTRL